MKSYAALKRQAQRVKQRAAMELAVEEADERGTRRYTAEQLAFLRNGYQTLRVPELTEAFNREFGESKTRRQIKGCLSNHKVRSGRTGRFEPGSKPFNTGTKGLLKANKTSFKKGSTPANRKPLGAERVCGKDGFILVKIAERDPHTGAPTRYKHKHVVVWEQTHGPVPEGMAVIFKDSDKMRCDIENLMLVSRAELLRLNQHGYREIPEEIKPSVVALARLEVKMFQAVKGKPEGFAR
jgi:hypothetical protein